jgi:hypothetical protein
MSSEIVIDEKFVVAMGSYRVPAVGESLLSACSKSPVVFAEKMLGVELYDWQVFFLEGMRCIVLNDVDGFFSLYDSVGLPRPELMCTEALAITSRQIGKSTSLEIFSLWCAAFNKKPGTMHHNTNVVLISRSDDQARHMLRGIRKLYRHGDRFMRDAYKAEDGKSLFPVDDKGLGFFGRLMSKDDPNNSTSITFAAYDPSKHGEYMLKGSKAGSSIICLPPTSKVLGFTFSIGIVDEAGHPDITDSFFFNDLQPTGDSTDALWIYTSTPWNPSGFFYDFCDVEQTGNYNHIFRVCFTIDAIKHEKSKMAQKQYENVLEKVTRYNQAGKIDEVQRSYYCRFVSGDSSYFDPKKVDACFDESVTMVESFTGECDAGIDFGGSKKSRTVVTITTLLEDGTVRRLYHRVYPVKQDLQLIEDMKELKLRFNIQRIVTDDCPEGHVWNRQMKEELGWNVVPVMFASEKVKKYGVFRVALHTGKLKSYIDNELRTEMKALESRQGVRNTMIEHAPGYSDDMIDSFMLSTYHYVEDDGQVGFYEFE